MIQTSLAPTPPAGRPCSPTPTSRATPPSSKHTSSAARAAAAVLDDLAVGSSGWLRDASRLAASTDHDPDMTRTLHRLRDYCPDDDHAVPPIPLDFLTPSDQPGVLGTLGRYQVLEVHRPRRDGDRAQGLRPGPAAAGGDQGAGPVPGPERDGPGALPPRGPRGRRRQPRPRRHHPRRRAGRRCRTWSCST